MAEETSTYIPSLSYDKEEFNQALEDFGGTTGFAQGMAEILNEDNDDPNFITYGGLSDGTAGVFDFIPEFATLSPNQRRLSPDQMIELFTVDTQGNPIEAGSFSSGFKREIIPAASSVPGFMAGYKAGNVAVAAVPPVTPPTAAIRILTPFVTGMLGSLASYTVGEEVTEAIMGEESPILPGTSAAYEAGRTSAGALAWLPMPFMVPKNLSFGVLQAQNFLKDGVKKPVSMRVAEVLEKTVGKTGNVARSAPLSFGTMEVIAGAGSTAGAYGSESAYEGQALPRITSEIGGAVLSTMAGNVLLQRLPSALKGIKSGIGAIKSGTALEAASNVATGFKNTRQKEIVNYILNTLENSEEDPDAVISALTSKEFESLLIDDNGNPIALTAGMKSGSPTIAALESAAGSVTAGLSKERNSANVQATRALRNAIQALYYTGNKEAIQQASLLSQSLFEADLENGLFDSVQGVFDAFERVRGIAAGAPERQAILGRNLLTTLENRFKAGRANERSLWRQTSRDGTIETFVDANGNTTDTPNFMSFWDNEMPNTAEAKSILQTSSLREMAAFVERKRNELFPELNMPTEGTPTPATREEIALQRTLLRISGTEMGNNYDAIMARIADLPTEEAVRILRDEATSRRGRQLAGSSQRTRSYADALDRTAELMILRGQRDFDASAAANAPVSPPASDEPLTPLMEMFGLDQSRRDIARADLGTSGNANLDNVKTPGVRRLEELAEALDAPEGSALRSKEATIAQIRDEIEELRDSSPANDALANGLERLLELDLNRTSQAASVGVEDGANRTRSSVAAALEAGAQQADIEVGDVSVTELVEMRTAAINEGRQLLASGNSNGARISFGFADALLKDLESFPEGVDPAYDTARAYSRAFNDTFTRTFAGDALGVRNTGASKVAPEMLANDIFTADAGYLRSLQLDGIGKFELTQSLTNLAGDAKEEVRPLLDDMLNTIINPENDMIDQRKLTSWIDENAGALEAFPDILANIKTAATTTTTVRGTTESILRNIRAATFDPETGAINESALRKWMEKPENADVLKAMPALKADLENSITANLLLKNNSAVSKKRQSDIKSQTSFYDLLPSTTENPMTAMSYALRSGNKKPIQSLDTLWKVAKGAPEEWVDAAGITHTREEAIEGFRVSLLESIFTKGGNTSLTFSPTEVFKQVFEPLPNSSNKISVSDWIETNEVIPKVELDRLKGLMTEMVKMESFAMRGDLNLEELAENVGPMMDFYLRITGSQAGAAASATIGGGGGDLIARGAGSKAFRQLYSKIFADIPESFKMNVMESLMKDPEQLGLLLKKGRTLREAGNVASRLQEIFVEKGFIPAASAVLKIPRRAAPSVIREMDGPVYPSRETAPEDAPVKQRKLRDNFLNRLRQDAYEATPFSADSILPQTPPVVPPTPQAQAAPPPNQASSSGPVDRGRYAALFPNDMVSGLVNPNRGQRTFAQGGIVSLMKGR